MRSSSGSVVAPATPATPTNQQDLQNFQECLSRLQKLAEDSYAASLSELQTLLHSERVKSAGDNPSKLVGQRVFGEPLPHQPEGSPVSDPVSASAWSNLVKILAAGAGAGALYAVLRAAYRNAFLDRLFSSTDKYRYHLKDVRSVRTPVIVDEYQTKAKKRSLE